MYYKKEKSDKWLGPGRVVCQDGKVIFVRHGGEYYRASPNRLMLAGTEIQSQSKDGSQEQQKEKDPIMLEDEEDDDIINSVVGEDRPRDEVQNTPEDNRNQPEGPSTCKS